MDDGGWGTPEPGATRALTVLSTGLDDLLTAPTTVLSDAELRTALVDLAGLRARAQAGHLRLVRELLARDTGPRSGTRTAQTLQRDLRLDRSRANADVQNAMLTDPQNGRLRELGAALEQGTVSAEHVDVARRAVRRIPARLMREQREAVAATLTGHALDWSPGTTENLARYLVQTLDPDRDDDRFDPDDLDRRYWSHTTDKDGMIVGRFQLPPSGRELIEQIDHLASPMRHLSGPDEAGPDEAEPPLPGTADLRTPAQRRADAVLQIARRSAAAGRCGTCLEQGINPLPATVVVHTTPEQMAWVPGAGCPTHGPTPTDDSTGGTDGAGAAEDAAADVTGAADADTSTAADSTTDAASTDAATSSTADGTAAEAGISAEETTDAAEAADAADVTGAADADTSTTDVGSTDEATGAADGLSADAATGTVNAGSSDGRTSDQVNEQEHPALVAPGPARCDRGGPLSLAALQRLACDAVIHRVIAADGVLQKLETLGRLATEKQRLALAARDGGCTFPRCDAPSAICDAHHIVWWTRGGATVITNLALLCQTHHDVIHTGQWQMLMTGGKPWFVPPAWLDPKQRPVRNTLHDATNKAIRTGQQLRLNLERDKN